MSQKESEVIKNIAYFVKDILVSAHSKTNWSIQSTKCALSWADYCEKMSLKMDLQPNIEMILSKLSTTISLTVTIHELKNAKQVLLSALIFNQLIPKTVSNEIILICKETLGENICNDIVKHSQKKEMALEKFSTFLKEPVMLKYFNIFKIRAIIEYSNNTNDYTKLNSLLQFKGSLHQILSSINKIPDNEKPTVNLMCGKWICSELEKPLNCVIIREIALLPKEDIRMINNLCNFNHAILKSLKENGDFLLKKQEAGSGDEYKYIVLILKSLLDSDLKVFTVTTVSSWLTSENGYFWHKAFSDASAMDKIV